MTLLCVGSSLESISRICGVSRRTVASVLTRMGSLCADFHNSETRNVRARRVQLDRTWSFASAEPHKFARRKTGFDALQDVFIWTALDTESKLILSWRVGDGDGLNAIALARDAQSRLVYPMALATAGHRAYLDAGDPEGGDEIDHSRLLRVFGEVRIEQPRQSLGLGLSHLAGENSAAVGRGDSLTMPGRSQESGSPVPVVAGILQNSGQVGSMAADLQFFVSMVALYTVWYNFVRVHGPLKTSPAVAAGLSRTVWSLRDLCALMDEHSDHS